MKKIKTVSRIAEGIAHLEDLGIDDFIERVENISKFRVAEKADGSAMILGIDNDGEFYTARNIKHLNYSDEDYVGEGGAMSAFRVAHKTLNEVVPQIKKIFASGEAAEIEILFGRQPNAITYGFDGFNYITFLRAIKGTNENIKPNQTKVKALIEALKDKTVAITTEIIDTPDGENLETSQVTMSWKFEGAQEIDTKQLKSIDLSKEITKFKKFLESDSTIPGMTNYELATVNLTSVHKDDRDEIRAARDTVNEKITLDFKLSIKETLLNSFVRNVKPKLQDKDVTPDEDNGIEGVVFLDPDTEEQFKLVDRDLFSAINTFNYQIRRTLSGVIRTDDPNADLESRGGLFGNMKLRIAGIFNIDGMGRSSGTKKVFAKFKGKDENETLYNFIQSTRALEFNPVKAKITAVLKFTEDELSKSLQNFKRENKNYKLTLKNGKTIGYSAEIVKRTLLVYAEVKTRLKKLEVEISNSDDMSELVMVLFGNTIKAVHDIQINENISMTSDLKNKSARDFVEAYFGTYLAGLVLLRLGDKKASRIFSDTQEHNSLKALSISMSPLNYWGMFIFRSSKMASMMSETTTKELSKISGRMFSSRIKEIHKTMGSNNNLKMNWQSIDENIRILSLRFEMRSPRINTIRSGLLMWDKISMEEKAKIVSEAFNQLQLGDSSSILLQLLRTANDQTFMNINRETKPGFFKSLLKSIVKEDDAGAGAGAAGTVGDTGAATSEPSLLQSVANTTTSTSVAPLSFKLSKGRIVRRVRRNFTKTKKF